MLIREELMARDSQRSKVYWWESKCVSEGIFGPKATEGMELAQCKELAREVFQAYTLSFRLEVKDGRRRSSACGTMYDIRLPRWSRKRYIVLHEVAHSFVLGRVNTLADGRDPGHGKMFMRVYLNLLEAFAEVNERDARKMARDMRIKIAPKTCFKLPTKSFVKRFERLKKLYIDYKNQFEEAKQYRDGLFQNWRAQATAKRKVSPERKATLRERAKKMREARNRKKELDNPEAGC
jgi:hypothetical protein